ncbi:MAG: hypothetical protein ACI80V_000517 [Rhodothermales bacterium]|jgi:hypothetical protein
MALPRLERINTLWFMTLGVTALAAAILVYILLLESALGAFSIKDASPLAIGETSKPSVALLESQYTKRVHRELNLRDTTTTWMDNTLLSWRRFLVEKERQISFRDISDRDLESGDLSDYDVLVLPSVRAMSDEQITAVKKFMDEGGSVLATWTPGVYRPDGSWRGWSFVEDVFGVEFQGFVERGVGNYRVYTDTFPGVTPEGIYFPDYLADMSDPEPFSGTSSMDYLNRETQRAEARATDFAPLRTYEWSDTLGTTPPTRDYARAQTVHAPLRGTNGEISYQQAVKVTYFTWIGGDPTAEIPYPRSNAGIRRFTLRGNTPLTANVPSGYRVKIQVYNPGVKVRVTAPERTQAAGFWYDFATDDLVSSDAVENTSGMVYGSYGKGRFIYLGFQRNAMGVGPDDREDWLQLADVFANMMNYLRRKPVIWVHDWPYPYSAAGMMTGVANTNVEGLEPVVGMLEGENFPGTFFVAPDNARGMDNLMSRMYDLGDVGVYDSLRTRSDGSTARQTPRLRSLREALEGMVGGRPIKGYRSSERGMLSGETMGGLVDADTFTYFMPDSIGRRTTPKLMGEPFESLTRIGVTARGDKDILGGDATISLDLASSLIQDGIRRAEYEGGLFNLVYSSTLLGQNVGVLRGVARSLKAGNFWNASGDEIAHWWRLHQGLNADVEQRGPSRIFVRVSNDNGNVARNASISISLGRPVESVNIRPELINIFKVFGEGEDIPTYELREGGTVLVMPIKELKPQQYRIFHIDLLGPETDPFRNDR